MDDILLVYLAGGGGVLVHQFNDLFGIDFSSFKIGDRSAFQMNASASQPRGAIVYEGDRSSIQNKLMDDGNSIRINFIVPENTNDITIGNIVVYAMDNGIERPVLGIVLPSGLYKNTPDATSLNAKYPSNRLVVSLVFRQVADGGDGNVNTTIELTAPSYSNVPYFGSDADVPAPDVNPYNQFIVNQMDQFDGKAGLVSKDDNGDYMASPLFKNAASPKFNVIGGRPTSLDPNGNRFRYLWGGYYAQGTMNRVGGTEYESDTALFVKLSGGEY